MRLGRIEFNIGYVVDLDNEDMVEHAKEAIYEDVINASQYGINFNLKKDEMDGLTENDIPDFLLDEECLIDADGFLIDIDNDIDNDNDGDAETDMEDRQNSESKRV